MARKSWKQCPTCRHRHKNRRADLYCSVACRRRSDPLFWLIQRVRSIGSNLDPQTIVDFLRAYRYE